MSHTRLAHVLGRVSLLSGLSLLGCQGTEATPVVPIQVAVTVSAATIAPGGTLPVTVTVTNTSARAAEIVWAGCGNPIGARTTTGVRVTLPSPLCNGTVLLAPVTVAANAQLVHPTAWTAATVSERGTIEPLAPGSYELTASVRVVGATALAVSAPAAVRVAP